MPKDVITLRMTEGSEAYRKIKAVSEEMGASPQDVLRHFINLAYYKMMEVKRERVTVRRER